MNQTLEQYAQALEERVAQDSLRQLRPSKTLAGGLLEISGKRLLNFASNDYLGLSQHPALIARSQEYAGKFGVGSGASRLLSGNLEIFEEIEQKLASLKGSQSALILPTGFQANSSVIPAILKQNAIAAADRLVHRSLLEGLLLSGTRWFRYKHNDLQDLQNRLTGFRNADPSAADLTYSSSEDSSADSGSLRTAGGSPAHVPPPAPSWLITESVFSMDGDTTDLPALLTLAQTQNLAIYIDEAHATGVQGKNGMGLTAGLDFQGISMGTFGKGLGSFGSYICCSSLMREYLINFCPGLIYSTALPPPVLGTIDAALDLVPTLDSDRARLMENAEYLRAQLKKLGFETGASSTQIIPIIVGSALATLNLSSYLENCGFYIPAIRPPTVPEGSARLRLSLSSTHTKEQIDDLLKSLRSWNEKTN